MKQPKQFIDSIDTTGGELNDAAKFNLLVSSVPSPWARVHLTQHALIQCADKTDNGILSKFYSFLYSEWRGLIAAYVLYPEYFELTNPIELVSKDISTKSGKFDILSTYSEMLFENAPLWKYEKGKLEHPKIQLLYYHNGDQRFVVGGTSPFSILFTGMNYRMPEDEQRIYWIEDGKFQDPADVKYETYYKEGETKYNDKHFNNLKKLYSFLNGVQKNCSAYISTLKSIWESIHDKEEITTDNRYDIVENVLSTGISTWMDEIKKVLGNDAEKSKNIPVNHKRPEGPLGELLNIKSVYYWRNNAFYTRPFDVNEKLADNHEEKVEDVENLFINSDYLAIWRDCAIGVTDQFGNSNTQKEHDYSLSPVHFIKTEENGKTWFLAVPLSEYALKSVFKQEFVPIIEDSNENVKIIAEKNGKKVDVYLKARIDAEGDWVNIRNRSFNVETPNQGKKVFAWPNFCSSKWQKYYYYSEFPMNATGDVQMVPVFEDMADIENPQSTEHWDKDAFLRMIKYPANATTDAHAYEIIRTNKPLRRIKIRKRIGNGIYDLGWLVLRQVNYKVGPNQPQGMQMIPDSDTLSPTTVGFDFGSTNSCAYYCGQGTNDIRPIPFSNRRLAIIGFDNKEMNTAEPNELLFISNEKPINDNGQIKSWLHEHDQMFIDPSKMGEELVGGVPVNETNINVKSMNRYDITTNAGKLHYNMKWLVDNDGSRRKKAFMKMVWIQICADLFAENMYPRTLNWSYPSAMGSKDMSALEDIFADIPSPSPNHKIEEKNSYTEAEAVCSYFLDKNISLEEYNLFVGMDIGGSTSDILVLGKEASATQQAAVKPEVQAVENKPAPASVDYDELGRKELCDLVRQRGLAGKVDLDELSRGEIAEFLKANEAGAVDYDELSRKELCELVRQRGLAGKVDLDELSRGEIVEFLRANEAGAVDYDELSRKELCDLASQRGVANQAKLDDMGRAEIVELLKNSSATIAAPTHEAPRTTTLSASNNSTERGGTDRRLFTQCSVRMAAGVFFDAIIGSKKFRDCIRNFHASKETRIKVEGIDSIDVDPLRAPYYLNNIFDQLRGDNEFKKFYGYLKNDVPFVFSLPAYILGALMTYSGMLVRNAIITHKLNKIEDIHLRYFGKGGRLFEWLFFTFKKDEVDAYLNACFEVGLKSTEIDKAFGRSENKPIRCTFDNCNDTHYGDSENSENKSEVARGLVSRHEIKGIDANRRNVYGKRGQNQAGKYDARKQEVIGEVGISRNGIKLNELDLVDDNFYEHEGSISMPRNFENFTEFMETFILFVGQATNVYPKTNNLKNRIKDVSNVRNFIVKDTEFRKYTENIRSGNEDSYRMPVFIATALYYLEEVLLKEVFSNN
ncbi:MAG: hypothetical protein IKJ23_06720 [Bacteroidaceae bacterium]|nr:hypothetical protein [Bacteroidaceae bacterium]